MQLRQDARSGIKGGSVMCRKSVFLVMAVLVALVALFGLACGQTSSESTSAPTTSVPATSAQQGSSSVSTFKIAYQDGFTGPMSYDSALTDQGIQTALKQLGSQVLGKPIEYLKADNALDPVQAVDKARQFVETKGIHMHMGPIFAPAAAAVTDYLAKAGGIPEVAILGWSSENMKTANNLSFVPQGFLSCGAYYFGKYVVEKLKYKTVSCLYLEDTAAYEIQAGFQKGFEEAGGKVLC